MQQSKITLIGGVVVGAFLLVYGSAILNRIIVGDYFMDRGLLDLNYIILALLCAVPFILASLIKMNMNQEKHFNMILMSGFLFAVHFIIVHWAFVYFGVEMSDGILLRTIIVFPISAFLIVLATYFGMNMEIATRPDDYSTSEL